MNSVPARTLLFLIPFIVAAQSTTTLNLNPANPAAELAELNQAIQAAAGSSIDLTRALEQHLRKYPDCPQRMEIESSLFKTATQTDDRPRIIQYGEKVLATSPADEMDVLDRVLHALLATDDPEAAKKALPYAKRYEAAVEAMRTRAPEGHTTAAQWADLADRAFSRATVLGARATGNQGDFQGAIADAQRSWNAFPTAESAQEMARWLVKLGRSAEAIDRYAEAVMIDDSRFPWSAREGDRKTATDLYVKLHGNTQGLGDLFMQAWDRAAAALRDRKARYKAMDPNYGLTDTFAFTLYTPDSPGHSTLEMASLKGKTLVIDFWATWCAPCIAQHPLIESVKKKYAQSPDVVFLSLDADDDHALVMPFLKAQKWEQNVYLEGGIAGLLNVSSLPTILVIDPNGKVYSRMAGFNGDTFESMLSSRIDGARALAAR